jgi:HSP20 family protein
MSTVAEQNTQANVQTEPQYFVSPGVNILENTDAYVLVAELPGVAKGGVDIDVEGTMLTLTGKRAKADLNATPLYRESSRADYRRVFELDPAIDTARIEAKIEQGVLTITLPKSERVKPRKVSVND